MSSMLNPESQIQIVQDDKLLSAKPVVSVIVTTFNQEKYIACCLEKIVTQQAPFDYEVLVGDDASTDQTRSICQNLQRKYPEKIRLILRNSNVGLVENTTCLLDLARGQYYAFCEGDDFFFDKSKLARQVSVLDAHPEVGLLHGRLLLQHGDYAFTRRASPLVRNWQILNDMHDWPTDKLVNHLLLRNYCGTPTVMIRASIFRLIYSLYCQAIREYSIAPDFDFVIWTLIACKSRVLFKPEIVAVRRMHGRSVTGAIAPAFQYNRLRGDALLRHFLAQHLDGVTEATKDIITQQLALMTAICTRYMVSIPHQEKILAQASIEPKLLPLSYRLLLSDKTEKLGKIADSLSWFGRVPRQSLCAHAVAKVISAHLDRVAARQRLSG